LGFGDCKFDVLYEVNVGKFEENGLYRGVTKEEWILGYKIVA
jgi:hypothetical protein